MKAFVAGATGTLGARVVRRLLAAGHDVVGLSRSVDGARAIEGTGATAVIGDALDPARMRELMAAAAPDIVFQLVNALPARGPRRFKDLEATNRLRDHGTASLLDAAVAAGARRFVAEAVIFSYGFGDLGGTPLTEAAPVQEQAPVPAGQPALDAMHRQEEQVLRASATGAIEGIVLRVGGYYGPTPSTDMFATMLRRRMLPVPSGREGLMSFVHIDDAADAVVLAAEDGRPGQLYNVVDDEPVSLQRFVDALAAALGAKPPRRVPPLVLKLGGRYLGLVSETVLAVDNTKAKSELGWTPAYPTYRDGMAAYAA